MPSKIPIPFRSGDFFCSRRNALFDQRLGECAQVNAHRLPDYEPNKSSKPSVRGANHTVS